MQLDSTVAEVMSSPAITLTLDKTVLGNILKQHTTLVEVCTLYLTAHSLATSLRFVTWDYTCFEFVLDIILFARFVPLVLFIGDSAVCNPVR